MKHAEWLHGCTIGARSGEQVTSRGVYGELAAVDADPAAAEVFSSTESRSRTSETV
jgi:hypothetical protein